MQAPGTLLVMGAGTLLVMGAGGRAAAAHINKGTYSTSAEAL